AGILPYPLSLSPLFIPLIPPKDVWLVLSMWWECFAINEERIAAAAAAAAAASVSAAPAASKGGGTTMLSTAPETPLKGSELPGFERWVKGLRVICKRNVETTGELFGVFADAARRAAR
ncbi:hypothetical protein HKX48_003395, partial [Thoreauomyces humboldtii]